MSELPVIRYRGECAMHHPLDEIYGPLVCKQCADERIAVLEARVEDLQAQIAVKDHAIKGLYKLSIQDERELAEERARLDKLEELLFDGAEVCCDLDHPDMPYVFIQKEGMAGADYVFRGDGKGGLRAAIDTARRAE